MRRVLCLAVAMLRAVRRWHLRARIAQLQALQRRPDLQAHPDYAHRGLVDARLAELRCELYVLEMHP